MTGPPPWVVKLGGALCDEPALRARMADWCARLDRPLVLVHGGGRQVTRLQRGLGLEDRFVGGRRATSAADLEAVELALSGGVNPALVRDLNRAGRRAAGLSGCDAGMIRCHPIAGLGQVGRPARVDPRLLVDLLASGVTPVVSPISLGPGGEALNVNADEAACALAVALRARRLLLLCDVSGVRLDGRTVGRVSASDVASLVASGQVDGGMIPKLLAAAEAARGGVEEVRIGGAVPESLEGRFGTWISARGVEAQASHA